MRPRAAVLTAMMVVGLGCNSRGFDLPPTAFYVDGGAGPDLRLPIGTDSAPAGDVQPGIDAGGTGDGPQPDLTAPAPDACVADLQSDPGNCGACGRVCSFPHALPLCVAGACQKGDCLPGYLDGNGDPTDGCEYACTPTNGGVEICDDRDNDCNGVVDEGTDKQGDATNCGACGRTCAFLHAGATCAAGACVLGACEGGFVNANRIDADGCECQQSNGGLEICDGFDNDCNGMVDDVADRNFENDPQNCGGCRINCTTLPHAVGTCQGVACTVLACEIGHHDLDGNVENGCEITCPGGSPGLPEVCDGIDNDCDGKIDADDDNLSGSTMACAQLGECAGTTPSCTDGQWICPYGPSVQMAAPNQILGNETWCDGKDNDCDGCIDESFPQVGLKPTTGGTCAPTTPTACSDTGVGACQGQGVYACAEDRLGVVCRIDTPGAAPQKEICDGMDNNCDGVVDNGDPTDPARVEEPMVAVSGGGLAKTVYVYAYEASRPDATAASAGASSARACARPGVLPWTGITYPEAEAACQAAGKRLCTEAEWQRACATAAAPACNWSFATACTTASTATCNTQEYDGDAGTAGDQDRALATGSLPACYARWSDTARIYDLSGNVKEWTKRRAAGQNPVRGGAFDTVLEGASCSFGFAVFDDTFRFGNTGFRCCADAP